jgi:RNA polymerase sigma-70 factor (ECF subfamily)
VALAAVDRLEDKLAGYHAYHATRADLLRRLGRSQESRAAYDKAIELAGNTAETAYLARRRDVGWGDGVAEVKRGAFVAAEGVV